MHWRTIATIIVVIIVATLHQPVSSAGELRDSDGRRVGKGQSASMTSPGDLPLARGIGSPDLDQPNGQTARGVGSPDQPDSEDQGNRVARGSTFQSQNGRSVRKGNSQKGRGGWVG